MAALANTSTTSLASLDEDTNVISAVQIVLAIIMVLVCLFICGSNALVIAAVYKSPSLRIISNMFVVNLAIADILFGLQSISMIITNIQPTLMEGEILCRLKLFITLTPGLTSSATLVGKCKQTNLERSPRDNTIVAA